MKITRRGFIVLGAKGLLGGIVVGSVPFLLPGMSRTQSVTGPANALGAPRTSWTKNYWGMICDSERCIGCGRCVVACKLENKVPWEPEYSRTWVERYIITEDGEVLVDSPNGGREGFSSKHDQVDYQSLDVRKSFFVPKLCNQCDEPPCVTVCPVGATYMTDDGVTLVDQSHCIGCGYCLQACPYGARFFLPEDRVVDKCTFCYHRIKHGINPACVEACPTEARVFGDLLDPDSAVRRVLAEKRVYVLKPELGTEPKVYYVGFEKGVH